MAIGYQLGPTQAVLLLVGRDYFPGYEWQSSGHVTTGSRLISCL